MKIRIEVDGEIAEDEVVIRCRELNGTVQKIQQSIMQAAQNTNLIFYKDGVEYYLPLDTILFFETRENAIDAHTADNVFQIKQKLYELEELLPNYFTRIAKSTIINTDHIYSIDRTLTSSGLIRFNNTHKQVYVSRNYYKHLKTRLDERRNLYG